MSLSEHHPSPSEQGQDFIWHLLLGKLNKEKSSNRSAPKKLLTPLPPSTHRTPRNGMHIPIPGLHRKLNPLRNKEKTVQLLSSTQSSGGVNDKAQHHTPWLDTLPNHRTSALLHKLAAGGQIHPLLKSGGHN